MSCSAAAGGTCWVTGVSWSCAWPVGGFDTSYNGGYDAFVAKINANGTLAWSSYLGGSEHDIGDSVSVDAYGNAWVSGETESCDGPAGGFAMSHSGNNDGFMAKINADGCLGCSSSSVGWVNERA